MTEVTPQRIRQWEGQYSVGWPEDPAELQEWLDEGYTPERTWETFLVRPPGPDMLAMLEYYLSRAPLTQATAVTEPWRQGAPARALDVLILHDALSGRSLDSSAAGWLVDQLWELVSIETEEPSAANRQHARFRRELRTAQQRRAKALARVRATVEELITLMANDWRDIETADYLAILNDWLTYWRDI